MIIYLLLTEARAHFYSSRSRALKVSKRAKRMGVKHEFITDAARRGDPYSRAKLEDETAWWERKGCTCTPGTVNEQQGHGMYCSEAA